MFEVVKSCSKAGTNELLLPPLNLCGAQISLNLGRRARVFPCALLSCNELLSSIKRSIRQPHAQIESMGC